MSHRLPADAAIGPDARAGEEERRLADFTMSWEAARLLPLAVLIGVLGAGIALVLLDLIRLFTNVFYYQRVSLSATSPAGNHLGVAAVAIPVVAGLVIGLMARFGSERIRGHGIPEAMETILVGGSKVEPRLAILKPISSAISIGGGGPFGAEGPIILTGGAVGSLVSQLFHLSAAERKTLLVAGAAAGMSAVFATPLAATLLAVELLLFEWKPRSVVMVAAASAVAAAVRVRFAAMGLVAPAPLFPVPAHPVLGEPALLGALAVGVLGGLLAWLLTVAVYGAEDAFKLVPLHWAWWPAIGGLVVGLGGLVNPRVLGVGYDTIAAELAGSLAIGALLSLLVVKLVVWAVALGSGTSGGILAPLLMMGAAAGAVLGHWLPGGSPALWATLGMAAALAGVMRSPFTGIVFAFELTRDANALLPLLIACFAAQLVSVLALKRSILTEKVARKGFHVNREYIVDPLEAVSVREVMKTNLLALEPGHTAGELVTIARRRGNRSQRLYPVVDADRGLLGVLTASDLLHDGAGSPDVAGLVREAVVVAHPEETLKDAVDRMLARRVGAMPVVERDSGQLVGMIDQFDMLAARERLMAEERHRERILRLRPLPIFARQRR